MIDVNLIADWCMEQMKYYEVKKIAMDDTTRAKLSADSIEVTLKLAIPQYKQINSKYLENKNGEKQYFTDLTEQMAVFYDGTDLLNIPGRTTKSKKIEKELMLWRKQSLKGSVICLEYRINGKKKIHRCMLGEMKE